MFTFQSHSRDATVLRASLPSADVELEVLVPLEWPDDRQAHLRLIAVQSAHTAVPVAAITGKLGDALDAHQHSLKLYLEAVLDVVHSTAFAGAL